MPALNLQGIAPLIVLTAGALIVLILDLLLPRPESARAGVPVALGAVLLAGGYAWSGGAGAAFQGAYHVDRLALGLQAVVLAAAGLAVLLSAGRTDDDVPGYLALLLWAASGMLVFVAAGDLLVAFLGLELLSLALYVLVAFQRRDEPAREAALKYFLLGGAASGVLLFGFALVYGGAGAVSFAGIAQAAAAAPAGGLGATFRVGLGLALVGFAFKLALVPFHAWAPDAYQAAPTPVTAFMSVATKAAAFGALLRFGLAVAPTPADLAWFALPVGLLGLLSMMVGSLAGLGQSDVKRMLAYSGITSAGYLTLTVPALRAGGPDAAAFYLVAYLFANVGAFAVVAWLEAETAAPVTVADLAGLYRRRPWLAAALTASAVSLIGIPPSAGFTGKLLLVAAGLRAAGTAPAAAWIPIAGLLVTTGISAYVYLRLLTAMFLAPGEAAHGRVDHRVREEAASAAEPVGFSAPSVRFAYAAVIAVCAVATVGLGLVPQPVAEALAGLVAGR